MRNLTKLIFQRFIAVSVGILLQLVFILLGMSYLHDYRAWMQTAFSVLSWIAIAVIVLGRSNPSYKIAWVVLILAFPVAGLTIYLLFGGNKSSSREHRQMQRIANEMAHSIRQEDAVLQEVQSADATAYNHARYLLHGSTYPIYHNCESCYYPSGDACYEQMLRDLSKAERYIFLEYFIIEHGQMWDSILSVLRRKAAEGVDVRVLYDDFGCIRKLPANYCRQLRKLGIRARAFGPYIPIISPRLNNRDHRKLMIIDGKVAFTGGINLADEYINRRACFGYWKDCGLRIAGPAAWSMSVMFLTMWDYIERLDELVDSFRPHWQQLPMQQPGFVQPFADSPLDTEDVGATVFQNLIQNAHERVWMMTPYLILDDKMTSALCIAAKTGIDVRIITPGIPDKKIVYSVTRANYDLLTEAGVRIFEFTPGFLHSKVCLADDLHAIVGTVNMDFRSLYLHYENAVYLYDTAAVRQVGADFRDTFPRCREITNDRCRHVSLPKRLMRSLLRAFSPLM